MNAARRPSRLFGALLAQLRRVNLFTRLLLVFCVLLLTSTIFIAFFNQTNYSREMETTSVKYLSVLTQNASFKLEQERKRFEDAMSQLLLDPNLLNAVQENRQIDQAAAAGAATAETAQRRAENANLIEQTLLAAKKRKDGIKTLIFLAGETQYSMTAEQNDPRGAFVRDLDAFYDTELCEQAVKAQGYPAWRDAVYEAPQLFFQNADDRFGIGGCITLSYQVYQPGTREPLGLLVCCIDPRYFTQALSEYSSQDGGNTFIVGENGMVEGISAGFSAPPFFEQRSSLLHQVFLQHRGSLIAEAGGREVLVSFCGQEDFPIHIVNLTYRDYVLQNVDRLGRINLLVLCIVIVVGIGCFYLAAVSISYPVNKLICTMKRVGAGDLSAVYQPEGNDEISVLCVEFNRMVSDMKGLIDRVYVSEIREKELELNEKAAQLDALQMQINPHFLYNTLDMIRWECLYEAGGESPASDMIEKFCSLLRMTIKGEQKKETVAESLLHASTYLEVVNFRQTSKIQLDISCAFEPSAYRLPCLSLQPILENAVLHGFSGDETTDGHICIMGELDADGNLVLRVSDNGQGMTPEQLCSLHASMECDEMVQTSIGLHNVNRRCKLCYGENYGIQIESELGLGTVVILTVPAEPAGETKEDHVV